MKKNISINISGIIFHIEEDGFDILKTYLGRIKDYFRNFDDSNEIIADIEGRIAEIFLSRLGEGKQVIDLDDINYLKATLGNLEDFKSTENIDLEDSEESQNTNSETEAEGDQYQSYHRGRRLYRDKKRKIIGGVAAGLANYFKIDALWFRLLFLFLLLDLFFTFSISIVTLVGYLVLWIILPGSDQLEEDKKLKKLYRNPDEKVIAGVSGGLGSFFGIDPAIFRLIFVITTPLGGAGLFAYLIFWIITPMASKITEKMQMKGEPITLTGIEKNIKKSLKVEDNEEENTLTKILLFPFRLIAMLLDGLAKLAGPLMKFLVEAARILAGIIIIMVSVGILFSLSIGVAALLGFASFADQEFFNELPILYAYMEQSSWITWAIYLLLGIPTFYLLLLGISTITKKLVFGSFIGWSLFALWFIALLSLAFTLPEQINQWKIRDSFELESKLHIKSDTVWISSEHLANKSDLSKVKFYIRAHEDSVFQLIETYSSNGSSREIATQNAALIDHQINSNDSSIQFDAHFLFKDQAVYRAQSLDIDILVPVNQRFRINQRFYNQLNYQNKRQIRSLYPSFHGLSNQVWYFDEDYNLQCVDCGKQNIYSNKQDIITKIDKISVLSESLIESVMDEVDAALDEIADEEWYIDFKNSNYQYGDSEQIVNRDNFSKVKLSSSFHAFIKQGDRYAIRLIGNQEDLERVDVNQRHDRIEFSFKREWKMFWNEDTDFIKVEITLPELKEIEVSGAAKAYLEDIEVEQIRLNASGAAKISGLLKADEVDARISSASKVSLMGTADKLEIHTSSASKFNGFNFVTDYCTIKASGASKADVYAKTHLEANASGASKISYRKEPKTKRIFSSGASKVTKRN